MRQPYWRLAWHGRTFESSTITDPCQIYSHEHFVLLFVQVTIFVAKIAAYRANIVDSLFCGSTLQASYEYQELSGEGFVGPWDTAASGELDYLCPWRILSDDTLDTDYDPSFLGGETGAAFFGDDATF